MRPHLGKRSLIRAPARSCLFAAFFLLYRVALPGRTGQGHRTTRADQEEAGMAPGSSEDRAEARDPAAPDLALVLHDIRQPLSAVFALAEVARGRPDVPAEVHDLLTQIIEEAQEVSAVLESVLGSNPKSTGTPFAECDVRVDVDELLRSVVDSFRRTWSGTLLREGTGGAIEVRGDRAQLRRCLVNLVDNAARAAGPDGVVTLAVERGEAAVRILIDDDGPGFGRVPRRTGLGLAATRQALGRMGGVLSTDLVSRHGGVCVRVELPVRPHGPDPVLPTARAV